MMHSSSWHQFLPLALIPPLISGTAVSQGFSCRQQYRFSLIPLHLASTISDPSTISGHSDFQKPSQCPAYKTIPFSLANTGIRLCNDPFTGTPVDGQV